MWLNRDPVVNAERTEGLNFHRFVPNGLISHGDSDCRAVVVIPAIGEGVAACLANPACAAAAASQRKCLHCDQCWKVFSGSYAKLYITIRI